MASDIKWSVALCGSLWKGRSWHTRYSRAQSGKARYSHVQCWKDPSYAIFVKSRRFEDSKYDTERYVWGINWGMSGASSVHVWGMSGESSGAYCQQWTTIRGTTCIWDAVFSTVILILIFFSFWLGQPYKLYHFVHWFQNCFCFWCGTLPSISRKILPPMCRGQRILMENVSQLLSGIPHLAIFVAPDPMAIWP